MNEIEAFLKDNENKELLRFSTAGSVDDGKSTLIGRLLHDSKNIYEDTLASVSKQDGEETQVDFALITDGLKAEREQGITIDVAYRYFSTPKRKYIIADTPGHEQYTRNMATGCSTANLSIILIDAAGGVRTQSKRHAFISSLLGTPHIIVAVNKMDLVNFDQKVFESIKKEFSEFAAKLQIRDLRFIPISALKGDNVVKRSENTPWYSGESLLEILDNIHIAGDRNLIDLRFPVQMVQRPDQNFRGYAGSLASGVLKVGDEVMALPSFKTSKVKNIVTFDGDLPEAFPPMSVTVTLEDEIDISRGDMLVRPSNVPHVDRRFEAMVVWMSDQPLDPARPYLVKHTTSARKVRIDHLRYRVDVNTLNRQDAEVLNLNEIGRVSFTANRELFFDSYNKNRQTGAFIMIDEMSNATVGAGMIINRIRPEMESPQMDRTQSFQFQKQESKVSLQERVGRFAHKPMAIWISGLVSSGKSHVAYGLERKLFDLNYAVTVLDGENVRRRLNRDLGFSSVDVAENLRRVAELTRMLNQAGMVVICAFVSPDLEVRNQAKDIIGAERFLEVDLDVPVEVCRKQDDTGLYVKADAGEISNLAGVSYPYEPNRDADLVLPLHQMGQEEALNQILEKVRQYQQKN